MTQIHPADNPTDQPASTGLNATHHRWLMPLGWLLALAGGAGTLLLVVVMVNRVVGVVESGVMAPPLQMLYEGLWLLFFASLFTLGISLVVSALRKVRRNAVPGPTLYVMGASLMVLGLMMAMYDQVFQAALSLGMGLVLMIAEWYYDEI
ncbi:MAG: hypothetical protein ACWA5X_09200 [bacterium]